MHLRHSVRLDFDSCLRNFGIDFNVQLFDFHEREGHGACSPQAPSAVPRDLRLRRLKS